MPAQGFGEIRSSVGFRKRSGFGECNGRSVVCIGASCGEGCSIRLNRGCGSCASSRIV